MEITWKVSDGYVGHGPQTVKVSDSELIECDTVDEALAIIEDAIQEDFQQTVSPAYDIDGIRNEVEKLFADKPKDE